MVRPHPAVWRLVHGAAVLYVLALVWLLFQTVGQARQALKVRDTLSTSAGLLPISTRLVQGLHACLPAVHYVSATMYLSTM